MSDYGLSPQCQWVVQTPEDITLFLNFDSEPKLLELQEYLNEITTIINCIISIEVNEGR